MFTILEYDILLNLSKCAIFISYVFKNLKLIFLLRLPFPTLIYPVEGWEGAYWEVVTNWNKYIPLNQRWKCSDAAYGGFLLHHVTRGTVQSRKTIQCIIILVWFYWYYSLLGEKVVFGGKY